MVCGLTRGVDIEELAGAGVPPRVFYVSSASKGVRVGGFVCCANKGVTGTVASDEWRVASGEEEGRRFKIVGAVASQSVIASYRR
jgi:hypothetical protein